MENYQVLSRLRDIFKLTNNLHVFKKQLSHDCASAIPASLILTSSPRVSLLTAQGTATTTSLSLLITSFSANTSPIYVIHTMSFMTTPPRLQGLEETERESSDDVTLSVYIAYMKKTRFFHFISR